MPFPIVKPNVSFETDAKYAVLACDQRYLAMSMEHRVKGRLAAMRVEKRISDVDSIKAGNVGRPE